MKQIALLGSTGSIGVTTLTVIRDFPDRFSVCALAAGTNLPLLRKQVLEFKPRIVSVLNQSLAGELKKMLAGHPAPEIISGQEGLAAVASLAEADLVISAMVGAAGLIPTVTAIRQGKTVGLANKETLVMAGKLIMEEARKRSVQILPIDSEHNALFQLLQGQGNKSIAAIVLTASGGPFLKYTHQQLTRVKPDDALKHPNWKMGKKVTIDSSSLMNKGLEVIEARWLFNMPLEKIKVYVHPQSIVHALVEFKDGSITAHLSQPDMSGPIAFALFYPDQSVHQQSPLNLAAVKKLEFLSPNIRKFRCLQLAYRALEEGETMPAVLNAANEIAVAAFLSRRIGFTDIPRVTEKTMDLFNPAPLSTIEDVLWADGWARQKAGELIAGNNC